MIRPRVRGMVKLKNLGCLNICYGSSDTVAIGYQQCICKKGVECFKIIQGRVNPFELCRGWKDRIEHRQLRYGSNTIFLN